MNPIKPLARGTRINGEASDIWTKEQETTTPARDLGTIPGARAEADEGGEGGKKYKSQDMLGRHAGRQDIHMLLNHHSYQLLKHRRR